MVPLLVLSACGGGEPTEVAITDTDKAQADAAEAASRDAVALAAGTMINSGFPTLEARAASTSDTALEESAVNTEGSARREGGISTGIGTGLPSTPTALPPTAFSGKGWYVDSIGGNDLNPGTQAAPWRTLAKAASATLKAGDAILLKCGATWREALQLGVDRTPLSAATVGIYGNCTTDNRPIISGVDRIQGVVWAKSADFGGRPVYATKWANPVSQLYWNGKPLTLARLPNYGGIGNEFGLVQSIKTPTSFTLSAAHVSALANTDIAGASIQLRTDPWRTEFSQVQSYNRSSGLVTLSLPTQRPIDVGEGYILTGLKTLLDAPGEWYYDSAASMLYIYTPTGQAPDTGVLETVQRDIGVRLVNAPDARLENLILDRQGKNSIDVIDSPRSILSDVVSYASGDSGIRISARNKSGGSKGTRVVRSTVSGAAINGMYIASPEVVVDFSKVTATGIDGQSNAWGTGILLAAKSDGSIVRNTTVERSAVFGINLGRMSGAELTNNTVTMACMRFTDCGGIYAWGIPGGTPRNKISSNYVYDMIPNVEGAVGGAPDLVVGIYFDEDSGNHDTYGNMISNVGVGIHVHDSSYNHIASNYIWPARTTSISVQGSVNSADKVRGNIVEDNFLFGATYTSVAQADSLKFQNTYIYPQRWSHHTDVNGMFMGSSPNIVRNNTTGSLTDRNALRWPMQSGKTTALLDRTQWAEVSPGEGQMQPILVNQIRATYAGSNLILNGEMNAPPAPWTHWVAPGSVGGSARFGECPGGCAVFTSGGTRDSLSSGAFSMVSAPGQNLYLVRLKAQSMSGANLQPKVGILRNSGDWSNLGLQMTVPVYPDSETLSETLFTATGSFPGVLQVSASQGSAVRIRQVSLHQVSSYELLIPQKEVALLANPTSVEKVINCAATGLRTCTAVQLNGQPVVWPVRISANSALPIMASDDKWLRVP